MDGASERRPRGASPRSAIYFRVEHFSFHSSSRAIYETSFEHVSSAGRQRHEKTRRLYLRGAIPRRAGSIMSSFSVAAPAAAPAAGRLPRVMVEREAFEALKAYAEKNNTTLTEAATRAILDQLK